MKKKLDNILTKLLQLSHYSPLNQVTPLVLQFEELTSYGFQPEYVLEKLKQYYGGLRL